MKKEDIEDDTQDQNICSRFLEGLLPPTGTKRKYSTTEGMNVMHSLNRIFQKYLGRKLDEITMHKSFMAVGYQLMEVHMNHDSGSKKDYISHNKKNPYKMFVFDKFKVQQYHIDINPTRLADLTRTLKKLPLHTAAEKVKKQQNDMKLLKDFFDTLKSIN